MYIKGVFNMIKKIMLISIILLLTIGIVAAADLNNLKMPKDFKNTGSAGMYSQQDSNGAGTGFNAAITKYTDADADSWLKNDTSDGYVVMKKGSEYWYTSQSDAGVVEVGELDGERYIIVFSTPHVLSSDDIGKCYDFMMEFNGLNNVKPVTV